MGVMDPTGRSTIQAKMAGVMDVPFSAVDQVGGGPSGGNTDLHPAGRRSSEACNPGRDGADHPNMQVAENTT
jgi:hypothetical protein